MRGALGSSHGTDGHQAPSEHAQHQWPPAACSCAAPPRHPVEQARRQAAARARAPARPRPCHAAAMVVAPRLPRSCPAPALVVACTAASTALEPSAKYWRTISSSAMRSCTPPQKGIAGVTTCRPGSARLCVLLAAMLHRHQPHTPAAHVIDLIHQPHHQPQPRGPQPHWWSRAAARRRLPGRARGRSARCPRVCPGPQRRRGSAWAGSAPPRTPCRRPWCPESTPLQGGGGGWGGGGAGQLCLHKPCAHLALWFGARPSTAVARPSASCCSLFAGCCLLPTVRCGLLAGCWLHGSRHAECQALCAAHC